MFDLELKTSKGVVAVRLKGDLNIQYVGELRLALLKILERSRDLIINIDATTTVDFACLQLLCSLHKEMIKRQRNLKLAFEGNNSIRDFIARAGYFRHVGCSFDTKQHCLWLGGVHE